MIFSKKKKKIAGRLADLMYILAKDESINPKLYADAVEIIFDIAYLSNGYKGMDTTLKYCIDLMERGMEE